MDAIEVAIKSQQFRNRPSMASYRDSRSSTFAAGGRRPRTDFHADEVLLYGSAVRGEMDKESDVDLLAILPCADWETKKRVCDVCFEAELEIHRIISVLCISKDALENSPLRSSPLVATVRREGLPQ